MTEFYAHFLPRDGYGYAAIKISQAMQRLDPCVRPIDMWRGRFTDGDTTWQTSSPALLMGVPDWLENISSPHLSIHTMFEADRLPAGWVDLINRHARLCIVPCQWCKDVFEDNGVNIPVEVALWGIDPDDYYPLERRLPEDRPYTFLWSGNADLRKGWDVAYQAFICTFGSKQSDVKLRLHFRQPLGLGFNDPNVEVVTGLFGRAGLRQMLSEVDCYLFPSRGEGWGLPPREAAATGLPVIATNYGGLAEEIDHWALPIEVAGFSDADYGFWGPRGVIGRWAEPSVDHLAEQMRWCYENRAKALHFGTTAALWTMKHATWERTGKRFLQLLS